MNWRSGKSVGRGEQCRGGGLCCSRCLFSDVNPSDWCDRKLLDFRGKQSSNPGFKKKAAKHAAAPNEDQMWTGWRGPAGDPVASMLATSAPPRYAVNVLYERGANGRWLGELPYFATEHFCFCVFLGRKKAIRPLAGKKSAGTCWVGY